MLGELLHYVLKIIENATFQWLVVVFLAVLAVSVQIFLHRKKKQEERVQSVVDDFMKLLENDGRKLKFLIPSGIADLKNDREIGKALARIGNRSGGHPLRAWKDRVETVGYKRFFGKVIQQELRLNKRTIEEVLNTFFEK